MTEDAAACARCGTTAQVIWCPAWREHLCPNHQHERTWRELDATQQPDGWFMAQVKDVPVVTL